MSIVNNIFDRIYKLTHEEGQSDFILVFLHKVTHNEQDNATPNINFETLRTLLQKIFKEIDDLASHIKVDETILISVRNQKLLRTCFQLVSSLGFSLSLIPGLGISLHKRCSTAALLPPNTLSDEQKYLLLTNCTDFFTRCFEIPVLKNIILTFHMCDYLAALIQLSFAPLKQPGIYKDFVMSEEMFEALNIARHKYIYVYEDIVANCFQPILMKELLVLQSVTNPAPPMFVKRVIAKELSRRLLGAGGLLSLIRCFLDNCSIDTGFDWKKIDIICKLITVKHGSYSENVYLHNMCSQLRQILTINNPHYLTTAVACVLSLHEKYSKCEPVKRLMKDVFQGFEYENLLSHSNLPGTVILSPQEIEHKVNVLHAGISNTRLECPSLLIRENINVLFLLGVKCTKNESLQIKLRDILLKCLGDLNKNEMKCIMQKILFGDVTLAKIIVEEFEAGLTVKCVSNNVENLISDAMLYFINLFKASTDNLFVQNVFEASLLILIEISSKRKNKSHSEMLLSEDDNILLDATDEQYANILQLLSEISSSPKVISALKQNPTLVLEFIEYFISNNQTNEECTTVALVLLNTILSNSNEPADLANRMSNLIPVLKKMENYSGLYKTLSEEALSLIASKKPKKAETACDKAIGDVFDDQLPVRAHGIIELTKLIDGKDPESISKRHYIFCLFQEQLKDTDSYIYLSAINGIASLGTHCTEDVLQLLCKEFLHVPEQELNEAQAQNQVAEQRMKIGDVIVKVTRRLGDMAVVYKTILLNTMLCGCRDEDPLIRTSALSNLAEIVLVLHFKIGNIIYEILLCIWGIMETDKAVECRRAAVMVITSLLKGLGQETLVELKDNLIPIYRTLKKLYGDPNEDSVVKLHAQIALEELNDAVKLYLFPEVKIEKKIFIIDKSDDVFK